MAENVIPRITPLDYDPSWGELFGAAFRNENVIGSAVQRLKHSSVFGEVDQTQVTDDDINKAVDDNGMSPFINHFVGLETRGDLNNKIAHIKQQYEDRQILDKGGWAGFAAQMTAGLLDAPTLVPFGHAVRLGRLGTESLKTTASKLAMTAALDASATEAALHSLQDLRTPEESALAVGGSMMLTTVLGTGIAKYLSKRHHADLSKRMETELPKLADGRAQADVADQFTQASENTARVMRGEVPEPHTNRLDAQPGDVGRAFFEEKGFKAGTLDISEGKLQEISAYIGPKGELYDLNTKSMFHHQFMGMVDAADGMTHKGLLDDMQNFLQLSVFRNNDNAVSFATGSNTPLTRGQLSGIRAAAKQLGVDGRNVFFREERNGGVSVSSYADAAQAKAQGFSPLSRYSSAENRARDAELKGTPPEDPELRQGLPSHRWDGEAQDAVPAPPPAPGYRGPTGDGTQTPIEVPAPPPAQRAVGEPPAGGNGGGSIPPGGRGDGTSGPDLRLDGPHSPPLTPSQMAFANSGGVIAATRGLSKLFGRSPILELMNSPNPHAREFIMEMAELPARTKGAYEGAVNPIAVQSRMAEYEGMRAKMTRDFYDSYKGWKQGFDFSGKDFERFSRNVSQSIVRNTFEDPNTDPNVAKAAKAIRDVISTMYERAVEQGLIRKDAWKPGDRKNPFVDLNDIRANAKDAEFDAKDSVDDYLLRLANDANAGTGKGSKKSKGASSKLNNENANMSALTREDAELYGKIIEDVNARGLSLPDESTALVPQFTPETGQRLARGGKTGERGLDYGVGLKFERGPNGELGDSLIQSGGLINRRYTDRVAHERDQFIRAETLAELQDKDFQIRQYREFNEKLINEAKERARQKGVPEEEELKLIKGQLVRDADSPLFHELKNAQLKRAKLISAYNHAKGSWEFIVHGTIKGGDARALGMESDGVRSPLHRRNVKLSDEVLLAKGWIDDDALGIANHTVRQLSSDVELARKFRRPMQNFTEAQHGYRNNEPMNAELRRPDAYWVDGKDPTTVPDLGMIGPREKIGKWFDDERAKLPETPEFDAARNKLDRERAMVLGGTDHVGRPKRDGLVDVVTDIQRGTHKISENSTNAAANLNAAKSYIFSARMGANVITNIGDAAALLAYSGTKDLMRHYAVRSADFVKTLASPETLANLATKWELPQERVGAILAREARAAGIAVETDLMSRVASQMDLAEPFLNAKAKDRVWQQGADWLAKAGSKAYFINVWTNAVRKAAYGIYVDRAIRAAMEPASISKHERVWLNNLGIDDAMLGKIAYEVNENKGAFLNGGVWHMQHDNWGDARVRSDFFAAARKDVNTANVSPSTVEKPLAFSNPIVNTMLQFWSFSFGATMRIGAQSSQRIISGTDGLASDGARTMLGIAAMVGVGMGTFALHNYASTWRQRQNGTLDPRDELPDFQDNWRQWVLQGWARSGVGGVFAQMGDVADNLGVNFPRKAIRSFDQDPDVTDPIKKFGRPNAIKNVAGPTAGLFDDIISAGRGFAYGAMYKDEDVKRSNVRAVQRNLPFINAFYLKSLTKELTEYMNDDVFQLPPDRR